MEKYQFGNIVIQIHCDRELEHDHYLNIFRVENTEHKKTIHLNIVKHKYKLPKSAKLVHIQGSMKYYETENDMISVYQKRTMNEPEYYLVKNSKDNITMYLNENAPDYYYSTHELLKHIELIQILIEQDMWVLHSCFVKSDLGAILFTGNSGAGKSTQGRLWEEFGNAEVINGDRSLIYKENGIYKANGFVYAGSSKICKNDAADIKAIVLVKQSDINRVSVLPVSKAIRTLYLQTVSSNWRISQNEKKLAHVTNLFQNVEVLLLECKPDKEAVFVLRDYLIKRGE